MKRSILYSVIICAIILLTGGIPQVRAAEGSANALAQPAQTNLSAAVGPTYYRTYGAYEFLPDDSDLSYEFFGTALYAWDMPLMGMYFFLPVALPNGAQVTQIEFYVIDNSVSDYITMEFYRAEPGAGNSGQWLGSVTSYGLLTTSAVQTLVISGAPITTIDNSRYSYYLRYPPALEGAAHMVTGARIEFQTPANYLAVITK